LDARLDLEERAANPLGTRVERSSRSEARQLVARREDRGGARRASSLL
jgi:hypothetical protein